MRRTPVLAVGLLAAVAGALAASQLAAGAQLAVRTVATGLNNPRGIEIGPDGSIFVAQAGAAGKRCLGAGEGGPEGPTCVGFTASIDRVTPGGTRERWAAGFFSAGGKGGAFSVGMDDVAISPGGTVYGIQTSAGPKPEQFGPQIAAQSGYVFRIDRGRKTQVANVASYEFAHNPDHANVDSDPYGIAWSPDGLAVADAAGNSLLRVGLDGRVTTLATFRPQRFGGHASQSVPTTVVWHDGAFYVGELGGGGQPNGHARIWRVVPGQRATVWKSGFTTITGLAFGPDGSVYVSELARNGLAAAEQKGDLGGALIRIRPDGSRTELAAGKLVAPAGVAVAGDGTVYVAVMSVFPSKGQLLAIDQS